MQAYLRELLEAGARVYEVGGSVRDRMLGIQKKDCDYLVCSLSSAQIKEILKPFGKIALVGQMFGVVKFSPHQDPSQTIDFALPRVERSLGVGHRDFEVDFDPDIPVEKDLGRRDFTINAMAFDISANKLIDPSGGEKDLSRKILRQVFPRAFEEDPLRLLRAVQFAARFSLTMEEDTWSAMRQNAHLIKTVSAERIADELRKLFLAKKPSGGFKLMEECGLLHHIFPELEALKNIEQDKQPGEDVYDHTMRVVDAARSDNALKNAGHPDLMWAALLHDTGKAKTARWNEPSKRIVFFGHQIVSAKLAKKILQRLRVETIGVKPENVIRLIENHMFETKAFFTDRAIRRFINKVGQDHISMLLDLRLSDNRGGKHPYGIKGVENLRKRISAEMAKKPPFGPKDLAINGHDIMELGVPEGPQIGSVIERLVDMVLDNPELNTKEQLLALAAQFSKDEQECSKSGSKKKTSPSQEGAGEEGPRHSSPRPKKSMTVGAPKQTQKG